MAKAAILLHKATQRFELHQFSSLAGEVGLQQVVLGNRVRSVRFNVRFGSKADVARSATLVRFVPEAGIAEISSSRCYFSGKPACTRSRE